MVQSKVSKFNVGELVEIRKDLKLGEKYGLVTLVRPMNTYLSTEEKIEGEINGCFYLENGFIWSAEMLIKK